MRVPHGDAMTETVSQFKKRVAQLREDECT